MAQVIVPHHDTLDADRRESQELMSTIGKLRTVRRKSPINLSSMHCALQEFSPIDHPERIEIGNAPGLFRVYELN
ncbi:hypothetical protein LMG26842_02849 [Achromobacter dolens]|nr:hypothetical protein LMG26842_02849 [Achromobacter dolens]